jgi:hypothetical protein
MTTRSGSDSPAGNARKPCCRGLGFRVSGGLSPVFGRRLLRRPHAYLLPVGPFGERPKRLVLGVALVRRLRVDAKREARHRVPSASAIGVFGRRTAVPRRAAWNRGTDHRSRSRIRRIVPCRAAGGPLVAKCGGAAGPFGRRSPSSSRRTRISPRVTPSGDRQRGDVAARLGTRSPRLTNVEQVADP